MSSRKRSPSRRLAMCLMAGLIGLGVMTLGLGPSGAITATYTAGELSIAGASCPSATDCVVVGTLQGSATTGYSEVWNGKTFKAEKVPSPKGATTSGLHAVSCATTKFCMAVGDYSTSSGQLALAELWSGKAWKDIPAPNPTGTDVYLNGVSCTSETACTAVGQFDGTKSRETWAARWSDKKWTTTVEKLPKDALYPDLYGVSCTSRPSCMAVGGYEGPAPDYTPATLAYSWSGKSWKTELPQTPTTSASISGVSCTSPSSCVTVGTLGETWNGTSWTEASLPEPKASTGVDLDSVSCASAKLCMGVGLNYVNENVTDYLTEAWSGKAWTIKAIPEPSTDGVANLEGVSCTSAKACVAVGTYTTEVSSAATLYFTVDSWNGKSWSLAKS